MTPRKVVKATTLYDNVYSDRWIELYDSLHYKDSPHPVYISESGRMPESDTTTKGELMSIPFFNPTPLESEWSTWAAERDEWGSISDEELESTFSKKSPKY